MNKVKMSILEKFYSDAFQDGFDYTSERLYAAPAGFFSQLRKAGPADVAKWKGAAASGDWRKMAAKAPIDKSKLLKPTASEWAAKSASFRNEMASLKKRPRPEMMQPSLALKKPMARPSLPTAEELRARKGQQILDNMRSTRGMAD